jgi:hypothetical protein
MRLWHCMWHAWSLSASCLSNDQHSEP